MSYMHRVKGIDFLIGYAVACWVFPGAGQEIFVRKTSSLQGSGRGSIIFTGGPLANFYGNLNNLGWRSGPPAFIRIRTCFFLKTFFTYLRIFHSVLTAI